MAQGDHSVTVTRDDGTEVELADGWLTSDNRAIVIVLAEIATAAWQIVARVDKLSKTIQDKYMG